MGAASLRNGGLVLRCPNIISSHHCFALRDTISRMRIMTTWADTLFPFSFPTGPISQSWCLITLNILHTSTESLRASEGFDCTQSTLRDAEVPHTYRFDGLVPPLTLFPYCMHIHLEISACAWSITHTQDFCCSFQAETILQHDLLALILLFVYFYRLLLLYKSAQCFTRHKIQIISVVKSVQSKQNRQRRQGSLRNTEEWRLVLFWFYKYIGQEIDVFSSFASVLRFNNNSLSFVW